MVLKVNYCFKGRFSNVSACGFHVNGQYVEVSKCAMHLGHSISSGDRTEIVKYAKGSFTSNMNDWHRISDNVCNKIDVLLDFINVREGNIRCDGFTGEEINFMIYDICVDLNCILIEYASFVCIFICLYLVFIYEPYFILCTSCILCIYMRK